MSRFYLRLILIPIALFTALLLIIRTLPYDDHELRQLLLPEGCPAPCFMGIRPGVTTMHEAMRLLKASDWVDMDTAVDSNDSLAPSVSVQWSGKQPTGIYFWYGILLAFQNRTPYRVAQIRFQMKLEIPFGSANLILGKPSGYRGYLVTPRNLSVTKNAIAFEDYYDAYHIILSATSNCPTTLDQLLKTRFVTVIYYDKLPVGLPESTLKDILRISDCQ